MICPASRPFGTTPSGKTVEILTISNGILTCEVLNLGATLYALQVPDRNGNTVDVVLGCNTVESCLTERGNLGTVVGRVANRIANGTFELNGRTYRLAINNGPNHIHGGLEGFPRKIWEVAEHTATKISLKLFSPDGEENYPGNLTVTVTYELIDDTLSLHYQAVSDQDTPCNLTNHVYFNLAGNGSGPMLDQEICLHAAYYTPSDPTGIPYGDIVPVAGTPMDLTNPIPIGTHINEPFDQLLNCNGYDHNYVIDGQPGILRPAAWAHSHKTGITLYAETTLPGLQFFTGNGLAEGRKGKNGAIYGPYHGFCLETQFFPDSPNKPNFPSAILKAGDTFDHITTFRFEAT